MAKTAIDRLFEWLDDQPPLMPRNFYKKQLHRMRSIEKHNIKRAYMEGYANYAHPRKYKMTPEEFFQKKYGLKSQKKPLGKERSKFKSILTKIQENVTNGNKVD